MIVILIIVAFLFSCSSSPHFAPVDIKKAPPSQKIQHHIVATGETLYSIAWRYNININKLAKKNNIYNGIIRSGQRLDLNVSSVRLAKVTQPKIALRASKPIKKPTIKSKKTTPKRTRSQKKTSSVKKMTASVKKQKYHKWIKPCNCTFTQAYGGSDGVNKGIEFTSKLGESIRAVSSGRVVFAGSGLRAYGNLVIIKHSESLLSAYAHNQKLLVNEGDVIRSGQVIATMGRSGTDVVKLYFEVRRNGKPIDPMLLLSK